MYPDIEVLSGSLRPFSLHPEANVDNVTATLVKTVLHLQTIYPEAPNFIMEDFNHCVRIKSLNNFVQYINCPKRQGKVLDQCYGTITGPYKYYVIAPLSLSDHCVVHLVPTYQLALKRGKTEHKVLWYRLKTLNWNTVSS